MKNTVIKLLMIFLAVCVATEASADKRSRRKSKRKKHKCCKIITVPPAPPPLIVGSWLFNELVSDIGSFSVLSVHSDGTLELHRSLSIMQPVPPDFPTGNLTTIDSGIWKERASNRFQVLSTSVVNIVSTGIPQDLVGTTPFARAKSELDITISDDGNSMTVTGTITLFEIDDLTLTNPVLDPMTGLPFVSTIESTGARLEFSIMGMIP